MLAGRPESYFVEKLITLGRAVRDAVIAARSSNDLAGVAKQTSADTIYTLDTHVEPILERFCEEWSREVPLVLIAEGIEDEHGNEGKVVFPHGTAEADAKIRIICDPVDGTRGLMYDKRAAWFLAGIAPNKGDATRLSDIVVAAQIELPTSKQLLSDVLWATKGQGAKGQREPIISEFRIQSSELKLRSSQADSLLHGFAQISNFFPGTKELSSKLMEKIVRESIGAADVTKGMVFDDQYISTGGQFYELMIGHDRFNADLRPIFYQIQKQPPGLCVHPYDVASMLIAQEAGINLTNGLGQPLDGPLDVDTPLSWAAFANQNIRAKVEPVMLAQLRAWLG